MRIQQLNKNYQQGFKSKVPSIQKKAIKDFTFDYLKKQDGYVSSKGSVFNGAAILMRATSGTTLTGWLISEMPKIIHDDATLLIAQVTTGLGSLAVAMSRLENDRAATGQAIVKVKPYLSKLKEAGFSKKDEIIYGIKKFMNKKGGFYTSIVPNTFSSKRVEKIFKEFEVGGV